MVDSRCPGAVAAKEAKFITSPPPCMTVSADMLSFVFAKQQWLTAKPPLWSYMSKGHCSKTLVGFYRRSCASLNRAAMFFFFFREKRLFLLATLSNKSPLFSLLLTVLSWTLCSFQFHLPKSSKTPICQNFFFYKNGHTCRWSSNQVHLTGSAW